MGYQLTPQQQQVNAMVVQAAAYSAYATALGVAISTMGLALETGPGETVMSDLRHAFGSSIVNQAVKNVGSDNMRILAEEINKLFEDDLRTRYGDYIANTALLAAPPGETKKVEDIARVLAGRGITETTPAPVAAHTTEVAKRKAARRRPAQALRDNKTGVVYKSLHAGYVAVAGEYGMDPKDSWGIYAVMKEDPGRFSKVGMDEYVKYKAELGG